MKQYKLGRLVAPDKRDKKFLLSAIVPEEPKRRWRYWYSQGWWGDQKKTSMCVAYAWVHWLEDGPVTHSQPAPLIEPAALYKAAQRLDEWPGEDYDGTSVRAGAKSLVELGWVQEYRWAWDLDTLTNAVLSAGPVVVGSNWYEKMFTPDDKGLIEIGGKVAGGHAYVIDGCNTDTELFRIKNSWNQSWGHNGFAYISFKNMERLIGENGEICMAVEKS